MLTGNKGEWSEIYALLKMLSDRSLYPGDANLEKVVGLVFPIVKVLRDESGGTYEYGYEQDLIVISGDTREYRIPLLEFKKNAVYLLEQIKAGSGTFSVPEIEDFITSFNCNSLKSSSSKKSDIRVVIHDSRTGVHPELGFSIKSQLGHSSTLLNAGRTTNFIFRIDNSATITKEEVENINNINTKSKIKDRIEAVSRKSGIFSFIRTETSIFGNNLSLIDSALPSILAILTFKFYSSNHSTLVDLVKILDAENPLSYDMAEGHPFYEYKIKRFLTDIALGMMPSKVWTGELDATGGYLIVKENGEVLCYHVYSRNEFESYLFNNTKLETASSTRHGFGTIYKVGSELHFNLNLQIRFMK